MFRKLSFALVAVMAILLSSVAVADWVQESSGNGAAKSGVASLLEISPGVPTGLLFPGNSGDVAFVATNNNDFPVSFTSVTGNGAITSDSATCNANGHQVAFVNQTGTWTVPANGSLNVTLANAATMGSGSNTACQGVTFTIPLVLAG